MASTNTLNPTQIIQLESNSDSPCPPGEGTKKDLHPARVLCRLEGLADEVLRPSLAPRAGSCCKSRNDARRMTATPLLGPIISRPKCSCQRSRAEACRFSNKCPERCGNS